jgi:nitrogen-specific signal transduction histidine kinase
MARKAGAEAAKTKRGTAQNASARSGAKIEKKDEIARLRTVAHDLSNALEGILQASYLLSQSKLDDDPKRWAQLIDTSSQEAARLNRELRQRLRSLGEE